MDLRLNSKQALDKGLRFGLFKAFIGTRNMGNAGYSRPARLLIPGSHVLFTNCLNQRMPPTRLPTCLHVIIRKILQTQQVQDSVIKTYLAHVPSLSRYNSAFKWFYGAHLTLHRPSPPNKEHVYFTQVKFDLLASTLIAMDTISPSMAKHAYVYIFPPSVN